MTGRKLRFYMSAPVVAGLACLLSFFTVGAGRVLAQGPSGPRPSDGHSSSPCGPQMGPWEWWNDQGVQKELGLTADKVKDINTFFEKRSKDLKPMADEFTRQRMDLDKMTQAAVTDEAVYSLQVLRVESLGARLRESRTMMLYRMYRSLQPDQNKKLQDILDRCYGRSSNNAAGQGRR